MNPVPILIDDVPKRFSEIPTKVRSSPHFGSTKKYLGAKNDGELRWPEYTSNIENEFGLGEHFQGIQRYGNRLFLSGCIKTGKRRSQIVAIEMGTRSISDAWSIPRYKVNGHDFKNPAPTDRVVGAVDLDAERWHAGGIQALGRILAVPIYGDVPGSEVRFYDVSGVEGHAIEIMSARLELSIKANAVGLSRRDNGIYILLVWDDEHLYFHSSQSIDILDGFRLDSKAVQKKHVKGGLEPGGGGSSGTGTYQNLNLIRGLGDKMFMIGTRNQELASPTFLGADFADLYEIHWPDSGEGDPEITLIQHVQFYCYDQQCNFGAGAGVYAANPSLLLLYGASHWLHGGNSRVNFNEYARS